MAATVTLDELFFLTERDYGFLSHCGEDARRWLAEFREEGTLRLLNRLQITLVTLRKYDLEGGLALLEELDDEIQARAAGHPDGFRSLNELLERYRLSLLAYYKYLNEELEEAKANLLAAHEKVKVFIGLNEFLMPMAIQCTDFIVQRARVARREKKWKEAEHCIWMIRDIFAGVRPFCVLDSGRPIGLPDLREFFAALPLDDEQRAQAHRFIGDNIPLPKRVEYLEEMVFSLPDIVIPYP